MKLKKSLGITYGCYKRYMIYKTTTAGTETREKHLKIVKFMINKWQCLWKWEILTIMLRE